MYDFTTHPLFERQVALEAEMVSRGAAIFRKKLLDAKQDGLESTASGGSHLMRRAIKPVADGIKAFLEHVNSGAAGRKHVAAQYLRLIDTDVAAFLALRSALNMLSSKATLQNAALTIANSLELEVRLAAFEQQNPDEYRKAGKAVSHSGNERYRRVVYSYVASKNEIELPSWPKRDKVLLGQKLLEIIIDTTGYLEIVMNYGTKTATRRTSCNNSYTYHVIGSQKCLDWLERHHEYAALTTPEYLPTIMPPRPWTSPYEGGYYTIFRPLKLVKTGGPNYMEELALAADDMPVLYEAINAMQDTGYRVNRPVLEVMKTLWESGGDVAGIPNRESYQLPRCPICGVEIPAGQARGLGAKHPCFEKTENEAVLKDWKREAAAVYERNVITMSKRFQFAKALSLADRFKEEEAFYFPMQLDFRGRCYAVTSFLTPQGADYSKGLLTFVEGKPLVTEEAVKWLAIHGSNVWGNDKVSLEDRHAWVLAHEAEILAVAADPYDCRFWQDADKPWQFLAFAFEWAAYKAASSRGETFISSLPVAMDGTCNGLQIFSLMLRDPIGGEATNLLPAEKPHDIYQIVADKTVEKLKDKAVTGQLVHRKGGKKEEGEEGGVEEQEKEVWYDEKDLARRLLAFGLSRKSTKRQVMVLPYGGTFRSCIEYTLEHIKDRLDSGEGSEGGINPANAYAASTFLATLIWESIGDTVVAARVAMGFLQKLASLAAAEGLPVTWTTPIGFIVSQAYYDLKEYRVKTRIGASVIRLALREEGEKPSIDKRRQRNGISPNFVHSLDAAAMCSSISLAHKEGITSFMMIHDSYGTHAADATTMAHCLRTAFVTMFTESNVLADLREEVAALLPKRKLKELPDLPEAGTLDINMVLQSAFFFA